MSFARLAAGFLSVCVVAVPAFAAEKTMGGYDPDYDLVKKLKQSGEERRAASLKDFHESPRESTLRVEVSAFRAFGLTDDLSGGDGWGGSFSMLIQMNSDSPDFKFLLGGELFALRADGGNDAEISSANLMFCGGCAYDFTRDFELGLVLGYGLLGATYLEDSDDYCTMNAVISVRPYAEFMVNKNFSVSVAYRYAYMGRSLIAEAADWRRVETSVNAVEIGFVYRF